MKTLFMMVLSLVSCCITDGQKGNDAETVIERMINSGSLEGHDQKVIGPMGDAAAVVLTKVLAGKTLTTDQIDSSLLILNMAFGDPSGVEIASDRKPRAALFVLQAFDHSVLDAALKKRIAETRKYIQEQYLKASQAHPN